jgi:hypothetical protein
LKSSQLRFAMVLLAVGVSMAPVGALLAADAPAPAGLPQPEAAKVTRDIAAFNRRQVTIAMENAKLQDEPAKGAFQDEARIKEELVAALEGLADAQEKGDNPKVYEFDKKQRDLVAQCVAAESRTRAAKAEVELRSDKPVKRLRYLATPLDMAQIEQFAALRERAADAWANFRKVSAANPDGRGVFSAQMGATQLTLAAERHQKIVRLQLEASRLRVSAEKSDTPDLVKKLADDIDRLAKEVGDNLQKQNELKLQELELNARTQRFLEEARTYAGK